MPPLPSPLRSSLVVAWLLASATSALAQEDSTSTTPTGTGPIKVSVLRVGGEEVALGDVWIGKQDCLDDAEIEFQLDSVPSAATSIDLYTGESCTSTTRNDETNNSCVYVGNFDAGATTGLIVKVSASNLIRGTEAAADCDSGQESQPKLWFLGVTTPKGSEDVSNSYGLYSVIHLDTKAPEAPMNLKGGAGETEIPIEWTIDDTEIDGFIVLIDSEQGAPSMVDSSVDDGDEDGGAPTTRGGTSASGECGSSLITPGAEASSISSRVRRKRIAESSATGAKLKPNDLGDSDDAAVAVVAVDKAGNESKVSEIVCVSVVPTEGFWDAYQNSPDAVDAGCPCHTVGPAQLQSAWPVGLSLAFVALSARRRRPR